MQLEVLSSNSIAYLCASLIYYQVVGFLDHRSGRLRASTCHADNRSEMTDVWITTQISGSPCVNWLRSTTYEQHAASRRIEAASIGSRSEIKSEMYQEMNDR